MWRTILAFLALLTAVSHASRDPCDVEALPVADGAARVHRYRERPLLLRGLRRVDATRERLRAAPLGAVPVSVGLPSHLAASGLQSTADGLTLRQYIDGRSLSSKKYAFDRGGVFGSIFAAPLLAELKAALPAALAQFGGAGARPILSLGSASTSAKGLPPHYHSASWLWLLAGGTKTWWFAPPGVKLEYDRRVALDADADEAAMRAAGWCRLVQRPGELLFLPSGWVHATANSGGKNGDDDGHNVGVGMQAKEEVEEASENAAMAAFVAATSAVSRFDVSSQQPFAPLFLEAAMEATKARGAHPKLLENNSDLWVIQGKALQFQTQICLQSPRSCPQQDPQALFRAGIDAIDSAIRVNSLNQEAQVLRCNGIMQASEWWPQRQQRAKAAVEQQMALCEKRLPMLVAVEPNDDVGLLAKEWLTARAAAAA